MYEIEKWKGQSTGSKLKLTCENRLTLGWGWN